ncbi:hypothetical protein ACFL0M_14980, partial [Thermodesulfobacteriota bacterium]
MDNFALCYFAVQVIERIFRLENFIHIARDHDLDIEQEVIETFNHHLKIVKEHLLGSLKYIGSPNEDLSYRNYRNILKIISHCILSLDRLHFHLSYIQGRWTKPETHVFVKALFRPFQEYIPTKQNFSVILSDTYMFEEVDLNKYLSNYTNMYIPPALGHPFRQHSATH